MKIKIGKVLLLNIMILIIFFGKSSILAYGEENYLDKEIDLLTNNKSVQDELLNKINKLEEEISSQSLDNQEVIKLSFVDNKEVYKENEEYNLKNEKNLVELEYQEYVIEEVKLKKIMQEKTKQYLTEKKIQYIESIWPIKSYTVISSEYGERIHPVTNEKKFHRGIDIPAPENTDILSVDNGIVVFSGTQNGYGNIVKIEHFDKKVTVYAHNSSNVVKVGDVVKRGDVIAKVGSTGLSTGNHLHFEIIVDNEHINPVELMQQ